MTNLKLKISAAKSLELVNELRNSGYIQGKDFDFAYYPSAYDNFTGRTRPSYVLFHFHNEVLATYYGLKWQ
jgi:hypothetical protein